MNDTKEKVPVEKGKNGCCSARDVLWYMVFIGFGVNYMIRMNLNIAIVSMVKSRPYNKTSLVSECIVINYSDTHELERSTLKMSENDTQRDYFVRETFDWDEKQQSNVLGSFFWLHWVTQIPGGVLASKYGTKTVFGLSNFSGVLCCFFIPMVARIGIKYLLLLRIFQGLLSGFSWPAMHNMTARWIPPNERSKFVTAYLGSSVGAAITYPLCGFIIHLWGWEKVFYTCGTLGTLWYIAWCFLVFDSPTKHPRISEDEKEHILTSLGQTYTQEKAPVPWRQIFTSVPVWMNVVAQWGGIWGLFTLMTHAPSYFKFIHGWSIQATGILSGLGHILRSSWSYICGQLGDYLIRTNKVSRTNIRKMATAGCTIGQGICLLILSFSGCNYLMGVAFLSLAIAMNGSVSTGPLACLVDISPNYASVILGCVNTIVALVGFICPAVVGYLTFQNQTVHQWQKIFWISTVMSVTCGIFYVIFVKAELQPWNSPELRKKQESELLSVETENKPDNHNGYEKVKTEEKDT